MTALQDPDPVRRAQARAVARRLHPDRGGDPAAYLAALAALDGRDEPHDRGRPVPAAAPASGPAPTAAAPSGPARTARALRRRARTTARAFRARVPRGLPGARRWASL